MVCFKSNIESYVINEIRNTVNIVFIFLLIEDHLQRRILVRNSLDF